MYPKEEFYPEIKFKISENLCEVSSTGALINQAPPGRHHRGPWRSTVVNKDVTSLCRL